MTLIMRSLACTLAMAACLAQAQTTQSAVHASLPPAIQPVAAGGQTYQVQVATAGSGRYTVIFESGFGTDLRAWRKVAPELAKTARVFTYSRAGHGGSEVRPEPRTIAQNSLELEQLIASAQLSPPFILVGHSYGALLMRAYAARHPGQVAGMVLVDPSDEGLNPALRRLDAARAAADERQFAAIVPPKFQGELKLLQPVLDSGTLPLAGELPDVPTVVLTSVQEAAKPEFFVESPEAVAIKRDLHARYVRRFSEGEQVLTSKSGHNIQLEEPELVIAAVERVKAAADKRLATGTAGGTPRTAP